MQIKYVWQRYKYVYMTTNCNFNFQQIYQNLYPGWQTVKLSHSVLTICPRSKKGGLKARHSDWRTTGLTWDGHFNLKGKMGVLKTSSILSPLLHDAITHEETQHYHQTTMKVWNHLIILQCLLQSAPVMVYSYVSQKQIPKMYYILLDWLQVYQILALNFS